MAVVAHGPRHADAGANRRRCRALAIVALALASATVSAGRPALVTPRSDAAIVARLPAGYSALAPGASAANATPVASAALLLDAAARTGDARLASRAEALLQGAPPEDPDALRLRAFAAQHRHDFETAARILSQLIDRDPRDAAARMSLAQVRLVQGQLSRARSECMALALQVDVQEGTLCLAAFWMRQGDQGRAAAAVDRWLRSPPSAPAMQRYGIVLRAEIAARSGDPRAAQWFHEALASAPGDVRTLAAYARYLRASGQDREALTVGGATPATDGLALQQALAAHALNLPDARRRADAMGRRYAQARAVGVQPELRDEAEYYLTLRGDAPHALVLAQRNFATQRDAEDVDVLLRSATAAHRPEVTEATRRWLAQEGIAPNPGASR